MNATPGWYADPAGVGMRYHDGTNWTHQHTMVQPATHTISVQGPNHALHAIITVFTCGFWAPIWIIVTIAGSKVRVTR